MRLILSAILLSGMLAVPAVSQQTFYSIFEFSGFIPDVQIDTSAVTMQESIYPEYYQTHSAESDLSWVRSHDSDLVAFWVSQRDTILHILSELSGIDWLELQVNIHLLRYFPSIGTGKPLILPLGGIKGINLTEAAPNGKEMKLNVVFQLSRRLLEQVYHPGNAGAHPLAYHPLMDPTPYRRDNLAMLLALTVCQNVLGYDTTFAAYNSAFWNSHLPGRRILDLYFLNKWAVTPEKTLANWIMAEPIQSDLVRLTRRPRILSQSTNTPENYASGLPPAGRLGFSVSLNDLGQLVVDSLDTLRLAFASGLQSGDQIRSVDGVRVRSHRDLIEKILMGLEQGGTLVEVQRSGRSQSVLFQPMSLPAAGDSSLWLDSTYWLFDTLQSIPDSTIPDSTDW